jgi:poly-beta-1,6-N-acetyl-D-glucosamine synthase
MADYVIVSPVKDEGPYIARTLESVAAQSVRPAQWLLVDDGSSDRTPDLIREFSARFPWIRLARKDRNGGRMTGIAEVAAFNHGYRLVRDLPFDFIVKLDGDLVLEKDYFERLLARFAEDERLGIASGVYLEKGRSGWKPVSMPDYHAAGASKVIRRRCFEEIGGFVEARGWDTVDEIRAQFLRWQTRHFPDLSFYHLRSEGSWMGCKKTQMMLGEVFYATSGSRLLFLVKLLHRAFRTRPWLVASALMGWGYLKSLFLRKPLLVTPGEAKMYRRLQWERILQRPHPNGRREIAGGKLTHVRNLRDLQS